MARICAGIPYWSRHLEEPRTSPVDPAVHGDDYVTAEIWTRTNRAPWMPGPGFNYGTMPAVFKATNSVPYTRPGARGGHPFDACEWLPLREGVVPCGLLNNYIT